MNSLLCNILNKVKKYKLVKSDETESSPKDLVKTQEYRIFQDESQRVRIEFSGKDYEKVSKVHKIVLDINNMPIDSKDRDYYAMDIANIYQIAYKEGEALGEEYATNLKSMIENNLILRRKVEFIRPCLWAFGIIMCITLLLYKKFNDLYVLEPILYGSLGGIVAVIVNNSQFDIDYTVKTEYIKFEAIKLVILSNVLAIIGRIAIDSEFILSTLDISANKYMMYLIYIICGFSQTFVPSILKNFEKNNMKG